MAKMTDKAPTRVAHPEAKSRFTPTSEPPTQRAHLPVPPPKPKAPAAAEGTKTEEKPKP